MNAEQLAAFTNNIVAALQGAVRTAVTNERAAQTERIAQVTRSQDPSFLRHVGYVLTFDTDVSREELSGGLGRVNRHLLGFDAQNSVLKFGGTLDSRYAGATPAQYVHFLGATLAAVEVAPYRQRQHTHIMLEMIVGNVGLIQIEYRNLRDYLVNELGLDSMTRIDIRFHRAGWTQETEDYMGKDGVTSWVPGYGPDNRQGTLDAGTRVIEDDTSPVSSPEPIDTRAHDLDYSTSLLHDDDDDDGYTSPDPSPPPIAPPPVSRRGTKRSAGPSNAEPPTRISRSQKAPESTRTPKSTRTRRH